MDAPSPTTDTRPTSDTAEDVAADQGPSSKRLRRSASQQSIEPWRQATRINYPKKRVSVACELCRRRKTKCDAKRPSCSFCSQIGATCNYRRTIIADSNGPQSEEENFSHDVILRLERIENLLRDSRSREVGSLAELRSPSAPSLAFTTPSPAVNLLVDRDRNALAHHHNGADTLVGLNLSGWSRLVGQPSPPQLAPLTHDEAESFLAREIHQGEALFQDPLPSLGELDLSPRCCWRLQQSFAHNILPWCPLFDQQDCVVGVTRTCEAQFPESDLETSFALFILALGAVSKYEHCTEDVATQFPGLGYFQVACGLLGNNRTTRYQITWVQCRILMSCYYLICLRPLQAFDSIHEAALAVLGLVQCKSRLEENSQFRQLVYRAYWACYLIEHELQSYFSYSSRLLQQHHEFIPLPLSDHDEPGIYWFLSAIAFRRIVANPRDGLGWNSYTLYAPVVAEEIGSQMNQWYSHLPLQIKFSLGMAPLLDPHKVFLRGQYYSVKAVLNWSYVVRLLTHRVKDEAEHAKCLKAIAKTMEYATFAVSAVEPIMQERHLLLIANLTGLFCILMLLLCTYDLPILAPIQLPSHADTIRKGRGLLAIWSANPGVAASLAQVDSLMLQKGIAPIDYNVPSPSLV